MAKTLGYGGIANTNGARDFTGKAAASGDELVALARSLFRFVSFGVFSRVN